MKNFPRCLWDRALTQDEISALYNEGAGLTYPFTASVNDSFVDEYQTVYDAFSVKPSSSNANAQDTFVSTLVSGSVWNKLDILYLFRLHEASASLTNFINPGTYNCSESNATFSVDFGWQGNSSDAYLDTNWNPYSNGVNYVQDSSSFGIYVNNDVNADVFDAVKYALKNDLILITRDQKPAELAQLTGTKYLLISNLMIAKIADEYLKEKFQN